MFNKGNKAVLSIIFFILDIITIIFVYDSTFQWDQWGLMFAFLTMPLALVALSLFVVWFILMLLSLKNKKLLFIIVPLFLILSFALSFGYGKIKIHMYNKNNNESLATEEDINKYKESFDLLKNDEMISCSKSDNNIVCKFNSSANFEYEIESHLECSEKLYKQEICKNVYTNTYNSQFIENYKNSFDSLIEKNNIPAGDILISNTCKNKCDFNLTISTNKINSNNYMNYVDFFYDFANMIVNDLKYDDDILNNIKISISLSKSFKLKEIYDEDKDLTTEYFKYSFCLLNCDKASSLNNLFIDGEEYSVRGLDNYVYNPKYNDYIVKIADIDSGSGKVEDTKFITYIKRYLYKKYNVAFKQNTYSNCDRLNSKCDKQYIYTYDINDNNYKIIINYDKSSNVFTLKNVMAYKNEKEFAIKEIQKTNLLLKFSDTGVYITLEDASKLLGFEYVVEDKNLYIK